MHRCIIYLSSVIYLCVSNYLSIFCLYLYLNYILVKSEVKKNLKAFLNKYRQKWDVLKEKSKIYNLSDSQLFGNLSTR